VFKKVLVANRGEIAIRAFRAAYELGIGTVAVYPVEDRNSVHRTKADESYQIGEPGHPVRAYLSVEAIIGAARAAGADAVYPGYGFLSENPDLAAACARADITFVGPSAQVLELTGNKARAIAAAKAAGLPVLASSEPSTDIDTLMAAAESMTFPVFVKAVAGGGGRGMRRVGEIAGLRDAIEAAAREAESAFGDATVFLEQAVIEPRHIEVQILADTHGNVIHLFERDCSVQRRHQKVVELAPAPNISAQLRSRLCSDAVAFARQIGYSCAGTVEFLVDTHGNHVFIEMNPRIQVEHTVTEEITDVDLVQAQLLVAAGETLADIGLAQDNIAIRGAALQCRITTEDPANGFRPDTGRITAYRTAEGAGIRLDGGTALGAEVSAYFDSMLVKLTCRGRTFPAAVARAQRAVAEFRIRGVATNLPFLQAVLADPDFRAGHVTTSFIEERPQLLTSHTSGDRGTKILTYLADVTVNKPNGPRPSAVYPNDKLPDIDLSTPPPTVGMIPVSHSEFAKDASFGYLQSDLRDWVQEKTAGRISRDQVATITLSDLRNGGPDAVSDILSGLTSGQPVVVDAVVDDDLRVLVNGILQAEKAGKRFLYRTGPSFVRARSGQVSTPPLGATGLADIVAKSQHVDPQARPTSSCGLIAIGSHVGLTTRQLDHLRDNSPIIELELDVSMLLDPATRDGHIREVTDRAVAHLSNSGETADVVIRTSRKVVVGVDADDSLVIARTVSAALVNTVHEVVDTIRPKFVVAKGGITSSDVATVGLEITRAWSRGTMLPGAVSLWEPISGPAQGIPYIVFAGNVGNDDALLDVVTTLRSA
jgi:acetyl/propionyl-CoA carboxylase alpha subunit/uncharacterized protein YgbK (DUF1537 family)